MDINKFCSCPVCHSRMSPLFSVPFDYRKPYNSKCYQVLWCDNCHFGQVYERPSRTEIPDFYKLDDYYTHKSSATGRNPEKRKLLDRLRTHLSWRFDNGEELSTQDAIPLLKNDTYTMCEIGCGNGGNLLKFVNAGFSVTGIEPDPAARDIAAKAITNVFDGTAEELPETVLNNKYDVVLMSHVLEHCLDIDAAISNVKTILKPEGIFIVETPNCNSYGFKDYQGEWLWSDIPRHLNFFTPHSLNTILTKYGFNVVKTKYRGFCRQFSTSWLEAEEEILRLSASHSLEKTLPNFKLRAWKLLFKSIISPKELKYDSVRLIAVKE